MRLRSPISRCLGFHNGRDADFRAAAQSCTAPHSSAPRRRTGLHRAAQSRTAPPHSPAPRRCTILHRAAAQSCTAPPRNPAQRRCTIPHRAAAQSRTAPNCAILHRAAAQSRTMPLHNPAPRRIARCCAHSIHNKPTKKHFCPVRGSHADSGQKCLTLCKKYGIIYQLAETAGSPCPCKRAKSP